MKIKKQAYLIMAHNNIDLLKKLLIQLDDDRFDLYIHIDKKLKGFSEIDFKKCVKKSNIYFLKRYSVGWGSFAQIKVSLMLLKMAQDKYNYKYYHFISGVDFPLKKSDYIYDFFNKADEEFIGIDNIKYDLINNDRIKYYYFFQEYSRNCIIFKCLNKILVYFQKILRINRLKRIKFEIQKGSNWFSITNECAHYVLEQKQFINKYFKYSFCADELFLQTIIFNSPYKSKVYMGGTNDGNLRFIDWDRGKPYIWKYEDKDELLNSKYLWARKINDIKLIEYISRNIGG